MNTGKIEPTEEEINRYKDQVENILKELEHKYEGDLTDDIVKVITKQTIYAIKEWEKYEKRPSDTLDKIDNKTILDGCVATLHAGWKIWPASYQTIERYWACYHRLRRFYNRSITLIRKLYKAAITKLGLLFITIIGIIISIIGIVIAFL